VDDAIDPVTFALLRAKIEAKLLAHHTRRARHSVIESLDDPKATFSKRPFSARQNGNVATPPQPRRRMAKPKI
jgi:hypothetical protein